MASLFRFFLAGSVAAIVLLGAKSPHAIGAGVYQLGAFWRDATQPSAATTLSWSSTPVDANQLTATWKKSASSKIPVVSQRIQFYSDSTCATPLGESIDVGSVSAESYTTNVTDGLIYAFKIITITKTGGQSTSACSPAVSYSENFIVDGGTYPSGTPYVPGSSPLVAIRNLTLQNSGYATIGNDVLIANVTITSSSQLTLNREETFVALNVSSGTLTATGFDNAVTSGAWSNPPKAGNGRLIFTLIGALTVGASGIIQMDGKGYRGGPTASYNQGGSTTGPGASSFAYGPNNGGGGGRNYNASGMSGCGGSYGSRGSEAGTYCYAGKLYGATDFWTQLYLGSGGGAGNGGAGGAGGGAISITADSLTFSGAGKITAKGSLPSTGAAGCGSGGSIVLNLKTFSNASNAGKFDVSGGSGSGAAGGAGRIGMNLVPFKTTNNNYSFSNTGGKLEIQVPADTTIDNLTVDSNASIVLSAASGVSFSNTGTVTVQNGGILSLAQNYTFQDVSVLNGTLTAPEFSNNQNGSNAWTDTPGAGNGKLIFTVNGTLTIGASGLVSMDGKGYAGAGGGRFQGSSYQYPGNLTIGTNNDGGGGGRNYNAGGMAGTGAGYGTDGTKGSSTCCTPGVAYGAADFQTQLYLGSGGGIGNGSAKGGAGGGAISISANNISITSGGKISSNGTAGSTGAGGGSGGTIVASVTSTWTAPASTVLSYSGAASGGSGGTGGAGRMAVSYGTCGGAYCP